MDVNPQKQSPMETATFYPPDNIAFGVYVQYTDNELTENSNYQLKWPCSMPNER